jgi:hypothetical protein
MIMMKPYIVASQKPENDHISGASASILVLCAELRIAVLHRSSRLLLLSVRAGGLLLRQLSTTLRVARSVLEQISLSE